MSAEAQLREIAEQVKFLLSCNVEEIEFSSGHTLDVYLALTPEQRQRGLSVIEFIDTSGMLFFYETPSYTPYTMINTKIDLDIAWYDKYGKEIQRGTYAAGYPLPIVCKQAFSFVLETPAGTLPSGSFQLKVSDG